MFLRNRTWPGTSTKASRRPDGSVVQAKPRSMVRPRAFSSAKRSGSIPVRARTRVDLPWSTWPAVATTCTRAEPEPEPAADEAGQRLGQHRVVGRIDRAQVADGATVVDPGDDRRVVGPQGGGVVAVEADAGRRQVVPGHRPPARHRHRVARRADAQRLGPPPQLVDRQRAMRQNGMASPSRAQVGQRRLLQGGQHQTARPQGPAQRMAGAGGHHVGPAGDHPGLGPAEQLVAGERHRRRAGRQRLAGRRLPRQPRRRAARPATAWPRPAGPTRCRPRPAAPGRPARPRRPTR